MQQKPLTKIQEALIIIGNQYKSEKEFEEINRPKYLLAKKQRVLKIIFPEHTCALPLDYENPEVLLSIKTNKIILFDNAIKAINKYKVKVETAQNIQDINRQIQRLQKQLKELLWNY